MKRIKIGVIDTGVNDDSSIFHEIPVCTSVIQSAKSNTLHGTAVCAQIINVCKNIELYLYSVFDEDYYINEKHLIEILNYIYINEKLDIINMSFGIVEPELKEEIEDICNKIYNNGTIIVSAFDNNGAMSYPACLPFVLGVSASDNIYPSSAFLCTYGSEVDIVGSNALKKIKVDEQYVAVRGTSFVAPIITGTVAKIFIEKGKRYSISDIKGELENYSLKKIVYEEKVPFAKAPFKINKAIVLIANKENHALMRFCSDLPFEIIGFYDFKYFFNVGKNISQVANLENETAYIIKGIESICWDEEFDTVIFGHINRFADKIGKNKILNILEKCQQYNKSIFSYDSFLYEEFIKDNATLKNLVSYHSHIKKDMVPKGRYGKLWYIDKPVLSIMGTRTKLGKFTLQQKLRKEFNNQGYKIGYLSTEPSGELFGADEVFPYGYNSSVDILFEEYIPTVNEMLHNIARNEHYDLIMTGSQSGTVPYDFGNMSRIVFPQIMFLYATAPDAVILCISCDDDTAYIKRTMKFIESSCDTVVIAIVIFPIKKEMGFVGQFKDVNIIDTKEYYDLKSELSKELGRTVFLFNDLEIKLCAKCIIDYYTN